MEIHEFDISSGRVRDFSLIYTLHVQSIFCYFFFRLHQEIQQFYEHMQSTPTERAVRENAIARIKSLVQQLWPNANIKLFGGFSSGLALPTSDIDIMILEASNQSAIQLLATKIEESEIAANVSIRVVANASVPLIEFVDRESGINIDLPFPNEQSLQEVRLLNEYRSKYPAFVKLGILLKQFLNQRDLNNGRTGKWINCEVNSVLIQVLLPFPIHLHRRNDIVCFIYDVHQFTGNASGSNR